MTETFSDSMLINYAFYIFSQRNTEEQEALLDIMRRVSGSSNESSSRESAIPQLSTIVLSNLSVDISRSGNHISFISAYMNRHHEINNQQIVNLTSSNLDSLITNINREQGDRLLGLPLDDLLETGQRLDRARTQDEQDTIFIAAIQRASENRPSRIERISRVSQQNNNTRGDGSGQIRNTRTRDR